MKMSSRGGRHIIDLLFTLALFCVFAASALMVVLIGANVYKNTVSHMDASFVERTSLTYVVTKVRQNDGVGGVSLTEIEGIPALALDQTVDGEVYRTWIYHYDGALRETFTSLDNEFDPENGQVIVEVPGFRFEQADGMLRLTALDADGGFTSQSVAPRCGLA